MGRAAFDVEGTRLDVFSRAMDVFRRLTDFSALQAGIVFVILGNHGLQPASIIDVSRFCLIGDCFVIRQCNGRRLVPVRNRGWAAKRSSTATNLTASGGHRNGAVRKRSQLKLESWRGATDEAQYANRQVDGAETRSWKYKGVRK